MIHEVFLKFSAGKLRQFESRIATCLDTLTEEQIWWRGAGTQNAVGNLVLHLGGNLGQWVLSGIGGAPDTRDRDSEFAAQGGPPKAELGAMLRGRVDGASRIIETLSAERLLEPLERQGYTGTVLEGIYHVVEHFGQHTGQIIYATKLLTAKDLGFYAHLNKPVHSETIP